MAETISKVVYGSKVLIDLTSDTVTADKLLEGIVAHDKSGTKITGSCTFDADTGDATATVAEILSGKTAYVNGSKLTGTMTNNGGVTGEITDADTPYSIPSGYHDGSSTEGLKPQQKTVTPKTTQQVVVPDESYNALSQVTVNAIPYEETANSAGGMTATIAGQAA